ncbi:MAG: DNA repair protein RecO [Chloroflexi bacterium]|nr:DNA repair protein RecO [Chloroflexota bacterium]
MTRPRTYQTEAIIIKKTKLGDADRILTLYTPRLGKIQGVAKGVRRPRSKLAGHLELLTYSQVSLARGRNLDTIIGSQTVDSFLPLKSDLWLTSCALYAAELVNHFTVDDVENYPLFQLLLETLKRLGDAGSQEPALRYFELHLVDRTGYRPQLRNCVSCHHRLEPVTNYFCYGAGGVLCPKCSLSQRVVYPLSPGAQKSLQLLQDSDYPAVSRLQIDPEVATELERVMGGYLKYLLEGEVKSAAWLSELREQRLGLKPDGARGDLEETKPF